MGGGKCSGGRVESRQHHLTRIGGLTAEKVHLIDSRSNAIYSRTQLRYTELAQVVGSGVATVPSSLAPRTVSTPEHIDANPLQRLTIRVANSARNNTKRKYAERETGKILARFQCYLGALANGPVRTVIALEVAATNCLQPINTGCERLEIKIAVHIGGRKIIASMFAVVFRFSEHPHVA